MALPGFSKAERHRSDKDQRGLQAIRYRAKRLSSLGREAYAFGLFWKQIVETGSVDFQGAYLVLDHKAEREDTKKTSDSPRKLAGILLYFILSSEEESQKLLKLMVAFCEPKSRRDLVLRQYPQLYQLQLDDLNHAEDLARSKVRQKMVRKYNSMAPPKEFDYIQVTDKKNGVKIKKKARQPTREQIELHAKKERKIRDTLCGENPWTEEIREQQRAMYHLAYALKDEAKTSSTIPAILSSPIQSHRSHFDFMSHSNAGC